MQLTNILLSLTLFTNTTFANVINNSININSIINNIEVVANNIQTAANNINISTGNNTTIKGANLEAISNHSTLEGETTITSNSEVRVGGGGVG